VTASNATIKKLHALMRDPVIPHADFDRHVREITGNNHRLIGIVCAGIVETNLAGLLKTFLRNGSGALFDPNSPLGTFSAKIEMAYRLGLIDSDIRRNADYIREIRNLFAHKIAPIGFKTPEVTAVCSLLVVHFPGFPKIKSARERYWRAALQSGRAIQRRTLLPWDASPATLPK